MGSASIVNPGFTPVPTTATLAFRAAASIFFESAFWFHHGYASSSVVETIGSFSFSTASICGHTFFERRTGAQHGDVGPGGLHDGAQVVRHRHAKPALEADDLAEIAPQLGGVDVDGADGLETGPGGDLTNHRGADGTKTDVQDTNRHERALSSAAQNRDYSIAMPTPAGPSVTVLLERARSGDRDALATLLPLVYDELRRIARGQMRRERPGQTLNSTGLVHEAWLRLSASSHLAPHNRAHFLAIAANVDAADPGGARAGASCGQARRPSRARDAERGRAAGPRARSRRARRRRGARTSWPRSIPSRPGSWSCATSAGSASRRPPRPWASRRPP